METRSTFQVLVNSSYLISESLFLGTFSYKLRLDEAGEQTVALIQSTVALRREAAMLKRSRGNQEVDDHPVKRLRTCDPDRLSHLSDELLLRTLSYLSVSDLALCQRYGYKY